MVRGSTVLLLKASVLICIAADQGSTRYALLLQSTEASMPQGSLTGMAQGIELLIHASCGNA